MIRKPPSLEDHDFPRLEKTIKERWTYSRGSRRVAIVHRLKQRKVVRKSKEVNVREGRDGRWEDGQIPWSVEWRGKIENGKGCGQAYSSASSATDRLLLAAALSGFLGASATRHLETKKKRGGKRLRRRGRVRGGGGGGCEEKVGGNAACWCGVVRRGLLAHLIQSWKRKKEIGRIQGWVGV